MYYNYYRLLLLSIAALLIGCSKSDVSQNERSSYSYSMDGSHHIPNIGVPSSSYALQLPLKNICTSAPVALNGFDSETYIVAQGKNIIIGSKQSNRIFATTTDSTAIVELLSDSDAIYAIHLNGSLDCYNLDGKINWHTTLNTIPKQGALLTKATIIISTDSAIRCIYSKDGTIKWTYHSSLVPQSICLDAEQQSIYLALSSNDAQGTDSIVCLTINGEVTARYGFPKTRITSNITSLKNGKISFGYLSGNENSSLKKTPHIALWAVMNTSAPKLVWDHTLNYLVTSVSTNGNLILSGGFRENGGELVSGIDAFNIEDTTKLWQRRFSYPLVAMITVSNNHAYIPFTFTTQASVPTKTIVSMINLNDGTTISELPVTTAESGFVQGVGTPASGMLLYADKNTNRIYFLKP